MSNAVEMLLERKALRIAWILDSEKALGRVPHFRANAAPNVYQCPVCWVQYELPGTLELQELPYTKDGLMRCRDCGDLTSIPSHMLEDIRK